MKRVTNFLRVLSALLMYVLVPSIIAQSDYKDYTPSSSNTVLFILSFDSESFAITIPDNKIVRYNFHDITIKNKAVMAAGQIIFDSSGLNLHDNIYSYDRIYSTKVKSIGDITEITFIERSNKSDRVSRFRRGNIFSPFEAITIEQNDFVRGLIFSITGDINVIGEVNRDIISLFGNISIEHAATVRANVLAMKGKLRVAKNASVYGELYSSNERLNSSRHRYRQSLGPFSFKPKFIYNRVDGFGTYLSAKYKDLDSLLPTVRFSIGYGHESERGRYRFDIEQSIVRDQSFVMGASVFRELVSEDDWTISDLVNSFYLLIAKEDLKDYYEAEGISINSSIAPADNLSISARYQNEETNWLAANQNIWSLFGGDKLFDRNFGTIGDSAFRDKGIAEIDTSRNVTLSAKIKYDNRDWKRPFRKSALAISASLEWSDPGFNSDFDYRRYNIEIRRYQKLSPRSMILGRFIHSNSDGYLPMHKRYYLGGLGSLRGYRQKELLGTRFWMINSEYRLSFPQKDLGLSILYDIAQIANEAKLDGNIDIKQNLGFAVYFGDAVRISIAKRLDRSGDNNPRIHIRLNQVF